MHFFTAANIGCAKEREGDLERRGFKVESSWQFTQAR
jgi:hypothetical protein